MLTILHLFNGRRHRSKLHFHFVERLRDLCEFYVYGPKEPCELDKSSPVRHKKNLTMSDLINEFHPDVILTNMKECIAPWAPEDFNKTTIPRVHIECDWWMHHEDQTWYEDNIDLLIQRGVWDYLLPPTIPNLWLPWSADEKRFFVDENVSNRKKSILFAGSTKGGAYVNGKKGYVERRKSIELMSKYPSLLDNKEKKAWKAYDKLIRQYVGLLGGNPHHVCTAKTIEAAASGTVFLTNKYNGMKELFGDEQSAFVYKDDCSDVVELAKTIVWYDRPIREIAARTYKIAQEKHMHKHRIKELHDIIKQFVETGTFDRKWGY